MTVARDVPETITVHVPMRFVRRGGRKEMQMPDGAATARHADSTLVKALARAFRWKRMLESEEFATIAEMAEREKIASSYMTRVLRFTLLAPEIVEAVLASSLGSGVTLARFLDPIPAAWADQLSELAHRTPNASNAREPSVAEDRQNAALERRRPSPRANNIVTLKG